MGLLDIFTGAPAKEAAQQQRQYLGNIQNTQAGDLTNAYGTAAGQVQGGYGAGLNDLTSGYNTATGAVNSGANDASNYLTQGTNSALGYLGQVGTAYDPLKALGAKYGGATTMALNSLGVNGAEGQGAARDAFQAGPAYNFNLDQGLEAINRRRNKGGMLNSGNADRDAQTYGAGLASNEYNTWMNNLLGFTNPELSATSGAATGQAGALTNSANIVNQGGINQAGVETGRGTMLANLAQQYGQGTAAMDVNQGTALGNLSTGAAGARTGLYTGLAQPYAGTYKQEADASLAGSANLWKLGLAGAQLAAGGAGGGSLGSLFGGGTASPAGASNAPSYPNPYGGSWYG